MGAQVGAPCFAQKYFGGEPAMRSVPRRLPRTIITPKAGLLRTRSRGRRASLSAWASRYSPDKSGVPCNQFLTRTSTTGRCALVKAKSWPYHRALVKSSEKATASHEARVCSHVRDVLDSLSFFLL